MASSGSCISNRWFLMIIMLVAWALLQAGVPTSCSIADPVRVQLGDVFLEIPARYSPDLWKADGHDKLSSRSSDEFGMRRTVYCQNNTDKPTVVSSVFFNRNAIKFISADERFKELDGIEVLRISAGGHEQMYVSPFDREHTAFSVRGRDYIRVDIDSTGIFFDVFEINSKTKTIGHWAWCSDIKSDVNVCRLHIQDPATQLSVALKVYTSRKKYGNWPSQLHPIGDWPQLSNHLAALLQAFDGKR